MLCISYINNADVEKSLSLEILLQKLYLLEGFFCHLHISCHIQTMPSCCQNFRRAWVPLICQISAFLKGLWMFPKCWQSFRPQKEGRFTGGCRFPDNRVSMPKSLSCFTLVILSSTYNSYQLPFFCLIFKREYLFPEFINHGQNKYALQVYGWAWALLFAYFAWLVNRALNAEMSLVRQERNVWLTLRF